MRTAFVVLFLSSAISAEAAQTESRLTLKDAIEIALQNNPAILAARQRVEAARGRLTSARAIPNPVLLKTAAGTFDEGPAFLSQTFDVLGKLSARSRSASAEVRVADAELQAVRLGVSSAVEATYVDVLAAIRSRDLTAEGVRLARTLLEKAQIQLEAGDVPRAHVVRSRLELGRLEQDLVGAEAEVAVRTAALNNLIARDPSAPVSPAEDLSLQPAEIDPQSLTAFALARRPELTAAQQEVRSRQAQVTLAQAQRNPDIALQVRRDGIGLWGQNTFVGVGVALPVFDWGTIRGAVKEAKANVNEQTALTRQLENLIRLEVESALRRLQSTRIQAENFQRRVNPDAEELLRMMLAGYPEGVTILEVIDAQRTVVATRTQLLQAIANYRKALAELRRAVGGEIPILPAAAPTTSATAPDLRRNNQ